jgi:hypothetical protein
VILHGTAAERAVLQYLLGVLQRAASLHASACVRLLRERKQGDAINAERRTGDERRGKRDPACLGVCSPREK